MLRSITAIFASLACLLVGAQKHQECGTIVDEKTHRLISERLEAFINDGNRAFDLMNSDAVDKIAVTAHIVRRSDGSGGLSEAELAAAFTEVNEFYLNANLEFFIFDEIDYVDSDLYYDFDSNYEDEIADSRDVQNTINIYFVNSLTSEGANLCGYAYFPGNPDRILMDNGCTVNGTTLSHEIGHYFTLYHTHGRTNTGTTDELVDGSNCETAGDELCDTSADPNLSGNVDQDCKYTGSARDANGDLFRPDPSNIMSYSRQSCRRLFSFDQYDRVRMGFLSSRAYLHQKEYLADFVPQISVACISDEIVFIDQSRGSIANVQWEFEGGSPAVSQEISPTVTYATSGVYDVTLTVYGEDGDSHIKYVSNAITIQDHSSGLDEISLDFEPGTASMHTTFSPGDDFFFETATVGLESSQSISMNFFEYAQKGQEDYLLLDPLANPGALDNILSFDCAFTYRATNGANEVFDELSILYKGCGNWEELWSINGKDGATANPKSTKFIPEDNDWVHFEMYLPVPEDSDFIQLAIKTINGNGNNLYLDNIKVSHSNSLVVRNLEITKEYCTGDKSGKIEVEASFNGQEVLYSLDNAAFKSSGTFDNLNSGEYTVFIASGGQEIQQDVSLNSLNPIPPKPLIVFSNDELRLLTTEAEVEWYLNDELIDDSGASSIAFQGTGVYQVIVRTVNGCENTSEPFIILGSDERLNTIEVYPNPMKNELKIEGIAKKNIDFQMTDLAGKTWFPMKNFDQKRINVSHLPAGIYLVYLLSESSMISYKVVKE